MHELAAQLIADNDGKPVVGLQRAAQIAGLSADLAYDLAREGRFPVFTATRAQSRRENVRVLIPALVDWMLAGGTNQYDERPEASTPGTRRPRDPELAWLDGQLVAQST